MEEIAVISGKDVTLDNVFEALALDELAYPMEYHLTRNTCAGYYESNDRIYIMLKANGKVIGYLNFSPLDENTYNKLLSGKYTDICVQPENVLAYESGKTYYAYLSSMVVSKEYRGKGYGSMLLKKLVELLSDLYSENIIIKSIVADAISEDGEIMVKKLGLKRIAPSSNNSVIYAGTLIPFNLDRTTLSEVIRYIYQRS